MSPTIKQASTPPKAEHAIELIRGCALFGGVDDAVVREVAKAVEWWSVPGGQTLTRPDGAPAAACVVLHGKLRVHQRSAVGSFEREYSVGELVGAVNLLPGEARALDPKALQDSEVGLLTREVFTRAAAGCPALWQRLSEAVGREMAALLRGGGDGGGRRVRHVAILPADEPQLIGEFCRRLADGLATCGSRGEAVTVKIVDRAAFEAALGEGAANESVKVWDEDDRKLARWINRLAEGYDIVLFQADPEWSEWTKRCVRQSESVLFVSGADSPRATTAAEEELLSGASVEQRDYRLVLIHPDPAKDDPTGTDEWLDRRPGIARVHHVRHSRPEDYERLARHLTGAAVGLVLGGGGARGQAHLGAVEALQDCGVHIDAVGGTSAGGGIAALTAYGQPHAKSREMVREAFVKMAPFRAYSLPFHSLMRKGSVEAPAKFLGKNRLIEDLWIPFFCVSCDISTRKREVHDRGRLWKALCATTALPGVLPPMVMRGKILVDGGVVDNIPIEPMRGVTRGPIIVVDVGARQEQLLDPTVLDLPVNSAVILSHVHPLLEPVAVPNLLTVVMSTMDLADKVRRRDEGDLEIRPEIGAYGITDFEAQNELVALGYNATIAALRGVVDEEGLRRLGTSRAQIERVIAEGKYPKRVPLEEGLLRQRDARLRRAFARSLGVLLVGLAVAGALMSAVAVTLAVIVALLALLAAIVSPAVREAIDDGAGPKAPGATTAGGVP